MTTSSYDLSPFSGREGETARLIEAFDWSATPLGAIGGWSNTLRNTIDLILGSPLPIVTLWGERGIMVYNEAYSHFAGARHPALLGSSVREGWGEIADFNDNVMRVGLAGGTLTYKDQELVLDRGGAPAQVWMDLDYSPILDESRTPVGVMALVVETSGKVLAQRALHDSEERYRAITDSVDQLIWSTLPDGYHDFYNQRWYDYTGVTEGSTDGEGWNGIFHPDDQERAWAVWRHCLATGEPYHIEYRLRHHSGVYRWVIGRAQPVRDAEGRISRWYGTCTDVHDLKIAEESLRDLTATLERRVAVESAARLEVEEALRQTQKMEAVGQLTGGIAHDFNNLLTVVTGNIDIAGRALSTVEEPDPRAKRALDNALKGAERAAALTQRLLAFARRQPLAPKQIDIDRLVSGMSDLLKRSLGEVVSLDVITTPGLWRIEADPNQLESAILNLAVNARDAMPQGGSLVIETANAHLDKQYAEAHADVAPGQYVVLAVTDTGSGMARETIERVFEPFFTTKEVGRGTGLGLSMIYGFVKQSGGHIKIYSKIDKGTTVKIYLPRLKAVQEDVEDVRPSQDVEPSHGQETILVVEDDEDVRAYTVEILRELGYRILEAHDGASGLRLLERHGEPIDLLFTDVVMPGMSGAELAAAARLAQPDLRVLFTSGYTRNAIVHGGRLDPGVEMISKPFTYSALAAKIRDTLDL
ncbi:PAS domain S-box-containing protein [Sphingomonas vulcanisoli]|uniref:histidine kinase n=1 Tax=Sphingomonas vulcanisoli TaxID=1658060 RepID=A0ABX0TVB7_9SPHN|nr:hybrid sensor histidine kinase/response regulator [Sphingomonas vulcanisoli]NIJ09481.1 PAS domain S-box-containing protein [Sphingomonas vulcanisoli]